MLYKNKSSKIAILKFGIVLPVLVTLLVFFSSKIEASEFINGIETVEEFTLQSIYFTRDTTRIMDFKKVDKLANFPKGDAGFAKYLCTNLRMPDEALKNKITGKIIVGFIVNAKGEVTNVKLLKGVGGGCDEEGVRVIKSSPKWAPALSKGKKVSMRFQIPIRFCVDGDCKPNLIREVADIQIHKNDSSKVSNFKPVTSAIPLYILDGKPKSKLDIDKLDKDDIESISILKDNSAIAIYGNKAKNGVVQIKTKSRGKGIDKNDDANHAYSLSEVVVTGYTIICRPVQRPKYIINDRIVIKGTEAYTDPNYNN